jgi:hypothetical protein
MKTKGSFLILLLAFILACHTAAAEPPAYYLPQKPLQVLSKQESQKSTVILDMPARFMWGWGPKVSGFCGSASIQTTALYYGNWISEGLVRASVGNKEILPGDNMDRAMSTLKMTYESWPFRTKRTPQHMAYWSWCKKAFKAGIPVIGTVFEKAHGKDQDYDHIVPFIGYSSNHDTYYSDDDIIYYNDLYYTHTLKAKLSDFVQTRKQCTSDKARNLEWCMQKNVNYGAKVLGFFGMAETLPAKLDVGRVDEPDWSEEDGKHEKPELMKGTLEVSGLAKGDTFTVYRFSGKAGPGMRSIDVRNLPSSGFAAAGSHDFKYQMTARGETATFRDPNEFMSDTAQFYRVIKDSSMGEENIAIDA